MSLCVKEIEFKLQRWTTRLIYITKFPAGSLRPKRGKCQSIDSKATFSDTSFLIIPLLYKSGSHRVRSLIVAAYLIVSLLG